MRDAVVVSAVRTALGKAPTGTLRSVRPEHTATEVLKEAIKRAPGLKPEEVDDVVVGCSFPEAEAGMNIGRVIALKAGLPTSVPGVTINRFCASGLDAVSAASQRVMCGFADIMLAVGVEHMSTVPMGGNKLVPDPDLAENYPAVYITMGLTAENVASRFNISREDQDHWGVRSQNRAEEAIKNGFFEREIVPVTLPDGTVVSTDDGPRAGTTYEKISQLKPVFRPNGTVTAGNACPLNDGAAAVVIMSDTKAKELGLTPLARIVSTGVSGLSPEIMGLGPIEAVKKALGGAKMSISDIDLYEINEAFAVQVLGSARALGMDEDKLNVSGGAIALGHPFGMTGARITATLLNNLQTHDKTFGIETMCVGGGQGMAMVVERLS